MNKLEKLMTTIGTSPNDHLRRYATSELVDQLNEYEEYFDYIISKVYNLIVSENGTNRINGSKIIAGMSKYFSIKIPVFVLSKTNQRGEMIYLGSDGAEYGEHSLNIESQMQEINKKIGIETKICNTKLVTEQDLKVEKIKSKYESKRMKIISKRKAQVTANNENVVQNIHDFFKYLEINMLSTYWYKRHGSFLTYCSLFSQPIKKPILNITLPQMMINNTLEILYKDKFSDFISDQACAPVREAAAILLKSVYDHLGNIRDTVIERIFLLLKDSDWQVSVSGLLCVEHLFEKFNENEKKELSKILTKLIESADEDVRYGSAKILLNCTEYLEPKIIIKKCWNEIKNSEDIALSKTSIILLLSKFIKRDGIIEDNIKFLFPCFRSPIPDVRQAVLTLFKVSPDTRIFKYAIQNLFIENDLEIIESTFELLKKLYPILENKNEILKKYIKILCKNLNEEYFKDEFCDKTMDTDLHFSNSGIKTLGEEIIMQGRIRFLEFLYRFLDFKLEIDPSKTNRITENYFLNFCSVIENIKMKIKTTSEIMYYESQEISKLLDDEFIKKTEKFVEFQNINREEFIKKITNINYHSHHQKTNLIFTEALRSLATESLKNNHLSKYIYLLYYKEYSKSFISFFTQLFLYQSTNEQKHELIKFFVYSIPKNTTIFFEKLKDEFFNFEIFETTKTYEKRFVFYRKTINCFTDRKKLEFIFYDVIKDLKFINRNIIQFFIKDWKYNQIVVKRILKFIEEEKLNCDSEGKKLEEKTVTKIDKSDLNLNNELSEIHKTMDENIEKYLEFLDFLIDIQDHSFNILFVRPLLRIIKISGNKIAMSILSKIIYTLQFNINPEIGMVEEIYKEKKIIEQLYDPDKLEKIEIKPMKLNLREYQIQGVQWINFLRVFGVNGILADDMGLGKTVQVISYLATISNKTSKSLIICPSSLIDHWVSEVKKTTDFLEATSYKKKNKIENLCVVSYETFRNDYQKFIKEKYFYLIVDEGHILRNRDTLIYKRLNMIMAENKLILTGTPVQNSVDDLFSLFNFLMPGYLGDDKYFSAYFLKPINQGKENKASEKEVKIMEERIKELHKKVLPFILRRLKTEVLNDLPPKIIRDILVDLTPKQKQEYDAIDENIQITYGNIQESGFRRVSDQLKICSYSENLENSSKLQALSDLFKIFGNEEMNNKILIFCQFKSTIENIKKFIKNNYQFNILILDGSVISKERQSIVNEFFKSKYQILLLTTQIGGLGLNLTCADTVIFFEHDWNPFNDLQAMDRAHRIGQKKIVNVFRIITNGTIEQRVMNLQNFKMYVANSIVSQQNADVSSMDIQNLLEKFNGEK